MESLETYLNDLENRLVIDQEQRLIDEWSTFSKGKWEENWFNPQRTELNPPRVKWPEININDALKSHELMVLDQFSMVSKVINQTDGHLLVVRSNYGVGILASLYGAEKFIMPREMNCLPNVRSLAGGEEALKEIINNDAPDLSTGYGADVFKVGEIYNEIFTTYPNIARMVAVDHPDCQSPVDILELLWGSDMFLGLYDKPDFTHALLKKISQTYKDFVGKWFELCPQKSDMHVTWGHGYQGKICLRDDSAMNISPEMYKEFIFPHNEELLKTFGGGSIHSCGRVDHFIPYLHEMKGLNAFNMSQPEYNDMEIVYKNTVDKGIEVFGMERKEVERIANTERNLNGLLSI